MFQPSESEVVPVSDLINQNNKPRTTGALVGFLGIAATIGLTAGVVIVSAQSGQDATQHVYGALSGLYSSQEHTTYYGDPFADRVFLPDVPTNDVLFYDPLEARFGEFARLNEITIQVERGSSVWQSFKDVVIQGADYYATLADSERLTGNLVEALGEQNPGLDLDNVQPCDLFAVTIRPIEYQQAESGHYPVPSETTVYPNSVIELGPTVSTTHLGPASTNEQLSVEEQGLPLSPTQSGTEVPFDMHVPSGTTQFEPKNFPVNPPSDDTFNEGGVVMELPDN